MKQCNQCGSIEPDHHFSCSICDANLPFGQSAGGGDASDSVDAVGNHTIVGARPNGETPMMIAWIALALCVFSGLVGWSKSGGYFADVETAILMSSISWLSFCVFLVLWPTGYIVRAISFLPGKADR